MDIKGYAGKYCKKNIIRLIIVSFDFVLDWAETRLTALFITQTYQHQTHHCVSVSKENNK